MKICIFKERIINFFMKKLLSRFILSFLYLPFISSPAKADYTNTSVQSLSSSDCANISVLTLANHAANDGPDANHTLNNCNVSHTNALIRGLEIDNAIEDLTISNDSDIATNSSNISSNDTDIATNSSNISSNDTDISGLQSLISTKSGSTTTTRIGGSTKNI